MKPLLLLTVLALTVYSQSYPAAVAKLCGNKVVHDSQKDKIIEQVKKQGCSEVRLVELDDNYYLVYGIRVLVGELEGDAIGIPLNDQ
jgi:hypothetical protein